MLVMDRSELAERIKTRKKALGYKELVIADDVNVGDEINMSLEDGKILITRNPEQPSEEATEEPDMDLIVKEFGVLMEYPTRIEVTLCDKYMLISLINGALDLKLGGDVMVASRGIDPSNISRHDLSTVQWVDVNKLLSFCQFWAGANSEYPFDYTYVVDCYTTENKSVTFRPADIEGFLYDISNGGLDAVEQRRALKEQRKQAQSIMNTVFASHSSSPAQDDDDEEFNIYDYVDSDEFNDEEDDDEYDYD